MDKLKIPVIITDLDGTVLYKNKEAAAQIARPRREGDIKKLLDGKNLSTFLSFSAAEADSDGGRCPTAIITLSGAGLFNGALVGLYDAAGSETGEKKGKRLLWLFFPFLRLNPGGQAYKNISSIVERSGEDIIKLFKNYTVPELPGKPAVRQRKSDRDRAGRLNQYMRKLLDFVFYEDIYPYKYSLGQMITLIKENMEGLTADIGYRLTIETDGAGQSDYYDLDYAGVLAACIGAIVFALEFSADKTTSIFIRVDEMDLVIEASASFPNPPFYILNAENLSRFARHYPADVFGIAVCELLMGGMGHAVSYSVREMGEERQNNFKIKFTVRLPKNKQTGAILHSADYMNTETGFIE